MFTVDVGENSNRKILVAIGICLLSLAGLGIINGSLSLYTVPITEELGVDRSVYAMFGTFSKITGALLAFVFAVLYRKLKAKGVVLTAGIAYALNCLCWSFAKSVGMIWLGGVFQGIGYTLSGALVFFAILPPWFKKNVGTVTGIAASMSGISSSVVIMLVTKWIGQYGYRKALLFQAVIVLVIDIIATLLVKTSPDDKAAMPLEEGGEVKKDDKKGFAYYKKMFSEPATLMCLVVFFLIGVVGYPITSLIVPLADTRGIAATVAAAALSMHYIALMFGKIGAGFIRDRAGVKVLTPIFIVLCIATTLIMGFGPKNWYISLGIIWGIGTVVNQIYPPYVMMDAFGKFYDPGFVGAGLAFYQIGRAIGEPAIHIAYDKTGSYDISMIIWTVLWVIFFVCVYAQGALGRRYQKKQEAAGVEPMMAE